MNPTENEILHNKARELIDLTFHANEFVLLSMVNARCKEKLSSFSDLREAFFLRDDLKPTQIEMSFMHVLSFLDKQRAENS